MAAELVVSGAPSVKAENVRSPQDTIRFSFDINVRELVERAVLDRARSYTESLLADEVRISCRQTAQELVRSINFKPVLEEAVRDEVLNAMKRLNLSGTDWDEVLREVITKLRK